MEQVSLQLRISLLNVPFDLSPLKLRGWLQEQARDIQEHAAPNAYIRLKIFLAKRQRYAFTQKKLDVLLQGLVDKNPCIHGVELIEVEHPLSVDEMQEAAKMAEAELNELNQELDDFKSSKGLEQFFGYNHERQQNESPFDLPEDGMVCMISNIIEANRQSLIDETGRQYAIGDWFVSHGTHQNVVINGPFKTVEESFEFGKAKWGAIRFLGAPVFSQDMND